MRISTVVSAMALCLLTGQVEARTHHGYHHRGIHARSHHYHDGRPRAWCGWYMTQLTGIHDRSLWIARNWARVGRPSYAKPGVVVVWPHHVGRVLAVHGRKIFVRSGNDGNQVRERWRSSAGVIAFREI